MSTSEAAADQERIMHEGLVSPRFLEQPKVTELLESLGQDTRYAQSVGKVSNAMDTLNLR